MWLLILYINVESFDFEHDSLFAWWISGFCCYELNMNSAVMVYLIWKDFVVQESVSTFVLYF